jgi:hypothetical protein
MTGRNTGANNKPRGCVKSQHNDQFAKFLKFSKSGLFTQPPPAMQTVAI